MNVENIMTKQPVCCGPSDTVQHVAQMMRQNDIGAMPVVSDLVSKDLVGIITDRDLCITAMADCRDPRTTPIVDYFTKTVVTCTPDDSLELCEQKMKQHRVRGIPVVDKKNECVGMVVQADLARVDKAESFLEMVAEISRPSAKRAVPLAVA